MGVHDRRLTPAGTGRPLAIVVTCEHAGNRVPGEHAALFATSRARAALESHRGYDPGALAVARSLGRRLGVPVLASDVTRLLVDLNRSVAHPRLHSEFSRGLSASERRRVVERYWAPHRRAVESEVGRHVAAGRLVLHVSVHSFAPKLNGRVRSAEVGLLYDPARRAERDLCARWVTEMRGEIQRGHDGHNTQSDWRIRRNYPYLGTSDGLTTALRRTFPGHVYLGIELELNQAVLQGAADRRKAAARVTKTLVAALPESSPEDEGPTRSRG